jgi:hypothetical protein
VNKPQPKEWYKTSNTVSFDGQAPYDGRYENDNAVMCDCPCHKEHTDIMHYRPCCKFSGVKEDKE